MLAVKNWSFTNKIFFKHVYLWYLQICQPDIDLLHDTKKNQTRSKLLLLSNFSPFQLQITASIRERPLRCEQRGPIQQQHPRCQQRPFTNQRCYV